jgi:hypothetical protein
VLHWIPVYHRYDTTPSTLGLLCQQCVETEWYMHHANLHLVAEHLNDVENIVDMLEKPWKYTPEWWTAFHVEQEREYLVTP